MRPATFTTYSTGFVLALLLTLAAFGLVEAHILSGHTFLAHGIIRVAIVALALIQLVVQLVCFLHLGRGSGARLNVAATGFALIFIAILVGGSLWIMASLNSRMVPSTDQMLQYMQDQSSAL